MKNKIAFLLALVLCFGLIGCTAGGEVSGGDLTVDTLAPTDGDLETTEVEPVSAESIAAIVADLGEYSEELIDLKSSRIASTFGLDESLIKTALCRVNASGGCPDTALVIEANSAEDAEKLAETLEAYRAAQAERWATYKAEQKPKLDSAVLEQDGVFVVFSVSDNNALVGSSVSTYLHN